MTGIKFPDYSECLGTPLLITVNLTISWHPRLILGYVNYIAFSSDYSECCHFRLREVALYYRMTLFHQCLISLITVNMRFA